MYYVDYIQPTTEQPSGDDPTELPPPTEFDHARRWHVARQRERIARPLFNVNREQCGKGRRRDGEQRHKGKLCYARQYRDETDDIFDHG